MMSRVSAINVFRSGVGEGVFITVRRRPSQATELLSRSKCQKCNKIAQFTRAGPRSKVIPRTTICFVNRDLFATATVLGHRPPIAFRWIRRDFTRLCRSTAIGTKGNIACKARGRSLSPADYADSIHLRVDRRGRKRARAGASERRHDAARSFPAGVHAAHRDVRQSGLSAQPSGATASGGCHRSTASRARRSSVSAAFRSTRRAARQARRIVPICPSTEMPGGAVSTH